MGIQKNRRYCMQISGGKFNTKSEDAREKNKKISNVILICIAVVVIAIIAIMCTIVYIQKNTFRVYIDGKSINLPESTIVFDDATGKIYVDIMGIASYLGYDAHKGEFKLYTEDENKCWVECKNETASFFLNSNKISKVVPNQREDYEDYMISDTIISKNNKLYCTPEGIRIGFNVTFDYREEGKNIQIYTLPYLVKNYTAQFKKLGYKEGIDDEFNNQKAILYNLFVVKKDNNLYGVVDSNNQEVIGSRYSKMVFNENAREFYVTNTTNKKGIVTEKGATKINLLYDEINMIDKNNGLYVVRNSGKYGILGNTGNIVIHLEYEQIGVDVSKFPNNGITNKYVLFENAIPVYQNKKWGMFDIKGNLILPLEYDTIGYSSGATGNLTGKSVNNLLIIPSYKAIVFGKDLTVQDGNNTKKVKRYGIYDNRGNELVVTALDNAYFVVNGGVNTYYMENNGKTYNIEEYLERHPLQIQTTSEETEQSTQTTNTNTTNEANNVTSTEVTNTTTSQSNPKNTTNSVSGTPPQGNINILAQ